jgi:hypothetical protein
MSRYDERIAICKACEHYYNGFCGTPFVGHVVTHNGEEMKLCGCLIHMKAAFNALSCPLDKWTGYLSEKDRIQLHGILKRSIESGTFDAQVMVDWYNKANPDKKKQLTTCVPCIARIRDELWMMVKDRK